MIKERDPEKVGKSFDETATSEQKDTEEIKIRKSEVENYENSIIHRQRAIQAIEDEFERAMGRYELDLESNELLIKLYPEYGERYNECQEWKDHVIRRSVFESKIITAKMKALPEGKIQQKNFLQGEVDKFKHEIVQRKSRIKLLRKQVKLYEKDKKEIYR